MNRFLDTLITQKSKIPSPDKHTAQRKDFLNDKKMQILKHDRKYEMVEIMKKAKETPGVAAYDVAHYDEVKVKPPKNGKANKAEKYSYVDEIIFTGK